MALKRLTTEEMVQISGPWVTEGNEARTAIQSVPELKGILGRVEAAHRMLHQTQPTAVGGENPRLLQLQEEAASTDLRHDTVVRGIHMLLSAQALLAGDPAIAEAELKLRDLLLPDGLQAIQRTYRAEAGAGELLRTRLSADNVAKKQLKETPVLKTNLGHYVEQWLKLAARLGELEDERAQISSPGNANEGARLIAARNAWIRAVKALVANGELSELEDSQDRLIFGALRLAEKTADRRMKTPEEPSPAAEEEKAPKGV